MRILYCIVHDPDQKLPAEVSASVGIEGKPLEFLSQAGVTAVTSILSAEKIPTDIKTLLAYQKVIDFFFKHHTLIPMRFGTIAGDSRQLAKHLADKDDYYKKLLTELAGCVEMGVRIPCSKAGSDAAIEHAANAARDTAKAGGKKSGRTFLAARKAYYESKERVSATGKQAAAELKEALQGLYMKSKVEFQRPDFSGIVPGQPREDMVSVSFLVLRGNLQQFQDLFRKLYGERRECTLSGPWPPYTFVMEHG